jgi:hypothetical protein
MGANGRGHEDQVRIFLRPIGSGLPLGFFSFGIGYEGQLERLESEPGVRQQL